MVDWAGSRTAYAGEYAIEFFTGGKVTFRTSATSCHVTMVAVVVRFVICVSRAQYHHRGRPMYMCPGRLQQRQKSTRWRRPSRSQRFRRRGTERFAGSTLCSACTRAVHLASAKDGKFIMRVLECSRRFRKLFFRCASRSDKSYKIM